ncbi:nucleoside 2-deoxyribosyltransferase [Candidatus Saccharibacteria bacterium]|nr:nucleoside 2-deoxyribosyltransferase [Candidatus Saccharibacteria bacterium]
MSIRGRIYIAGPSVFAPNALEIGKRYKEICKEHGFIGFYPLDASGKLDSRGIFRANKSHIDEADIIVADINFFRGSTVDDGTAWEIGYGYAKGKEIFCYLQKEGNLIEKLGRSDENGYSVEDFGNPVNLMIAEAAREIFYGDFEDCIRALAAHYP